MFKYFALIFGFALVALILAVLAVTSPFIMIYGICLLFVKKPEQKPNSKIGFITSILKDFSNVTNKSKTTRLHKEVGGTTVGSVRRFATEQENNEQKPS